MNSPLPPDQLHGADASNNLQILPISAHVHAIRHPTLGFPELLLSGQPCRVVLSLPVGQDPNTVGLTLTDRHRGHGDVHLSPLSPAASLGLSYAQVAQNKDNIPGVPGGSSSSTAA